MAILGTANLEPDGGYQNSPGDVWHWGRILDDFAAASYEPRELIGLGGGWTAVAPGFLHFCGLRADGSLWCWGSAEGGRLGVIADAGTKNLLGPVQVGTFTDWKKVSVAADSSCALRTNGTIACWGADDVPRPDGTHGTEPTPIEVGAGISWKDVWKGQATTFALASDGGLYQWGTVNLGLVDEHTDTFSATPTPVSPQGGAWISATSGASHACALRDDGIAWCWGQRSYGQLGDGQTIVPTPTLAQ